MKPTRRSPAEPGLPLLWSSWLGVGEVPPSFDHHLSGWLRAVAPDAPARARLGATLAPQADAALIWATLAAFQRFAGRRGASALPDFCAQVRHPGALWRLLRGADARFFALCAEAAQEPPPVCADLRALGLEGACVAAGVPPWHAPMLAERAQRSGLAWVHAWLGAQRSRPPLWLRLADPAQAEATAEGLRAEGLAVELHPGALRVQGPTPINHTQAWITGLVEVQDLGSQAIGALLPLRPGARVWDCCAGKGGKTLQLASRLGGRGAVHASDLDPRRLSTLRQRANRAGLANVRTWPWDGQAAPALPVEVAREGGFDAVLVDAPCSGSGTWRRKPDGRLRGAVSGRWAEQQRQLLRSALGALRPGGALVYATCSVAVLEDEAVTDALLREQPGLTVVRQGLFGAPEQDADTLYGALYSFTT